MRKLVPAAILCTFTLIGVSKAMADTSSEFVSTCSAQLAEKNVEAQKAKSYCICAEKQRHGVLDDRDQRAMNEALAGKKNAVGAAYPELNKEQLAEKLDKLHAILTVLAEKADKECGVLSQ